MSRKGSALTSIPSDETSDAVAPADVWPRLFGCPAPGRMDAIVAQAVAWQRQVLVHGDVAPAIARDLAAVSAEAEAQRTARKPPSSKPMPVAVEPSSVTAATGTSQRVAPATPRRRAVATPLPPASSQLLVGTRLVKSHGGETHVVEVTAEGMLYAGELFASLSAVAKRITGTHWNGLLFFGLRRRKTYPAKEATHG